MWRPAVEDTWARRQGEPLYHSTYPSMHLVKIDLNPKRKSLRRQVLIPPSISSTHLELLEAPPFILSTHLDTAGFLSYNTAALRSFPVFQKNETSGVPKRNHYPE